jgi:hypothetical protein
MNRCSTTLNRRADRAKRQPTGFADVGNPKEEISMKLKMAMVALAALGGVTLSVSSASAMPNGLPQAGQIGGPAANIEQARWICNYRHHCWWRPNWRGSYGYYGRPHFHRHHRWHRWHR